MLNIRCIIPLVATVETKNNTDKNTDFCQLSRAWDNFLGMSQLLTFGGWFATYHCKFRGGLTFKMPLIGRV